jgi:hypothetical protein
MGVVVRVVIYAIFEVFTAVTMKNGVSCEVGTDFVNAI